MAKTLRKCFLKKHFKCFSKSCQDRFHQKLFLIYIIYAILSLVLTNLDKGPPLPKFGEWDVNDPASAEGFTVIFNKARNEKKTGGRGSSPVKGDPAIKQPGTVLGKPQSKKWLCCVQAGHAES